MTSNYLFRCDNVLIEDITKLYMRGDITVTEYYDLIIKCEILNSLVDINEVLDDISNNIK